MQSKLECAVGTWSMIDIIFSGRNVKARQWSMIKNIFSKNGEPMQW